MIEVVIVFKKVEHGTREKYHPMKLERTFPAPLGPIMPHICPSAMNPWQLCKRKVPSVDWTERSFQYNPLPVESVLLS